MDLPEVFDVLLLGTSLPQAILAAALSAHGLTVLHVDPSPLYGSYDATVTPSDLNYLSSHPPPYLHKPALCILPSAKLELEKRARDYALSLRPGLVRSHSPLIDVLVGSRLSKQCAFQLVQGLFLYTPIPSTPASATEGQSTPQSQQPTGKAVKVPSSKEDIFSSPLPLLTKRKLMRFLLWCTGTPSGTPSVPGPEQGHGRGLISLEELPELRGKEDMPLVQFLHEVFRLDDEGAKGLTYAVAQRVRATDPTLPGLRAIRQHLLGTGRYGASAYLLGHYGGPGELAQLFCRMAAVRGTPYILGHAIEQLKLPTGSKAGEGEGEEAQVKVEGIDEVFRARKVVLEPAFLPRELVNNTSLGIARCIVILEETIVAEEENLDTALLVFPPGALGERGLNRAVTCLWTGEGSKSTPYGRYAVYLSVPRNPGEEERTAKDLLEPYLKAFIPLTGRPEQEPLLTFFYDFVGERSTVGARTEEGEAMHVLSGIGEGLVDGSDRAAELAQEMFAKVVGAEAAAEGMWAGLEDAVDENEDDAGQDGVEEW
ncbi:FAD/NADP-binding domain-containing protein [Dacryopinax primogenitus]|uniref:FAD/NADP-binding domain-containing protein n=1 Tax=Dacryopinax primogenitus (strain DJM 731) TaxID=1858805 RepID=M5GGS1_DACPD|nr:FAD/NADP-binding domain-containing protein [Dacryopinax primogenitus]EJU05978.1 FAD/NADP-binding domain-containing protein [Dacryopinax primogenitus]